MGRGDVKRKRESQDSPAGVEMSNSNKLLTCQSATTSAASVSLKLNHKTGPAFVRAAKSRLRSWSAMVIGTVTEMKGRRTEAAASGRTLEVN